jgi:hypothetical protein
MISIKKKNDLKKKLNFIYSIYFIKRFELKYDSMKI